ncbi:hypothetical protein F4553_007591 [Allocatelliglobosispora scoriae]|uniref:YcxB family protein n=1 Tax=Allocatelliglobosispora scoriae TaxID=643052 RepID=A0A841BYC9_9ACTN|nr:hypothetical protein [Allocatelliglobosispora scoriae]MBB5874157.1 hypothetical protein [Allocatelliglobosispora scoriae]
MQPENEDAVEVTITPTVEDYRSAAYRAGGVFGWNAALSGLLVLGAFLSWAATQMVGAIICGGIAALLLGYTYLSVGAQLRALPQWAFAEQTYRLASDGLAMSSPVGHHLVHWSAISATRKDPIAYWFSGAGNVRMLLFRRTLSAEQEAALDAAISRFAAPPSGAVVVG